MSVTFLLLVAALCTCIASTFTRCPLWISVLLVIIAGLLGALPR